MDTTLEFHIFSYFLTLDDVGKPLQFDFLLW
jgi:hypothetical protein